MLRAWWAARRRRRLEARVRRALALPYVAARRRLAATTRAVRRHLVRLVEGFDCAPAEREAMRRAGDRALATFSGRPPARWPWAAVYRADQGRRVER